MDRAGARILHSENEREAQGMESIWEKTCKGPARPPLYGKAQADVAVIGGGMTGILTALELQERGLQVVVAEAGHVGPFTPG